MSSGKWRPLCLGLNVLTETAYICMKCMAVSYASEWHFRYEAHSFKWNVNQFIQWARLKTNMLSYWCRNSHYKNKTVSWESNFYWNGKILILMNFPSLKVVKITTSCAASNKNSIEWEFICLEMWSLHWDGLHDDVIKWKHFPRYWPFVQGIHRWPVNSPHKSQWHGALMFSLICAWINGWVNNRDAGDLRRHRAHYDVTVMWLIFPSALRRVTVRKLDLPYPASFSS